MVDRKNANNLALLVKYHTYVVSNVRMYFKPNSIGTIKQTNHLKNNTMLINKLKKLVNMVNNDISLLDKDLQSELWQLL